MTFDGHDKRLYPFFIESVSDITEEGWAHVTNSRNLSWVIIPNRSRNAVVSE
jgi:hypothetical protein